MQPVEVLISEEDLRRRTEELGEAISAALPEDAREQGLALVGPLKGCLVFMADLARALWRRGVPVEIDVMHLSSYGAGTESSGRVVLEKDLTMPLAGRHVLLVDDIADTGHTLHFARRLVLQHEPLSLVTAVMLDKPSRRLVDVPLDYVGFTIPNVFVIGYGTDLDQRYRQIPYVGIYKP